MALFLVLSTIRIKVTTRVQIVVGIVTVAIILIVDVVTTAKGGSHGQALSAFTFGHSLKGGFSGVFYGIILGVTSYIGFETAADFGEETANPRRYIPIAVIAATVFAVVFYLLDHVLDHHRLRRQQRREVRRRPGRAEDHRHHVRRPLARHAGGDRRHGCRRSSCAWPARRPPLARCSRWAARACCRRRSRGPTRGSRPRSTPRSAVTVVVHRDGPADGLPVVGQRVRRSRSATTTSGPRSARC